MAVWLYGCMAILLMLPSPRRQTRLHYRLYLIDQGDQQPFNRGKLMNIGFVEAMKDFNWTCVVFHDVDLLPEDDRNLYTCPYQVVIMIILMISSNGFPAQAHVSVGG